MRMMHSAILAFLALLIGTVTLPAVAANGLQPAVMAATVNDGSIVPVIFKSSIREMKVEEIAAIAAGAAVVGTAADMFLDNGLFTIVAIAAGAAVGSYWYEEELWPFH